MEHRFAGALVGAFLAFSTAQAQDVLDKIAQESCSCATQVDTTADEEQRNIQLGLCMLQSASPYQKELKKKHGIDLNDLDRDGERFGELIGMRLALQCPEFVALMTRLNAQGPDAEEPPPSPEMLWNTLEGTLSSVKSGQFLSLLVKRDDGSTIELLLLEHAENAEQVLRRPDQGRGTAGTWSYTTSDLYDPVSRSYRPFHVLRAVAPRP